MQIVVKRWGSNWRVGRAPATPKDLCKSFLSEQTAASHLIQAYSLIKWDGKPLSAEASMTCVALAACNCDRVPALLFVRPFCNQRRWNLDGEIEIQAPPPAEQFPQWPRKIFVPVAFSSLEKKDYPNDQLHSTALGFPTISGNPVYYQLSPSLNLLSQNQNLSIQLDEGDVFLSISTVSKEDIWKQTSIPDRLFVWFELLKLVIYAFPDTYAESLWRRVACNFVDIINSAIVPFLSVLDWSHLSRLHPRYYLLHIAACNVYGDTAN